MKEVAFRLNISAEEYLDYYRGVASLVHVTALDGRTVQFPAHVLRPFVSHEGIRGVFKLKYADDNRFAGIERIA